MMFGLFFEIFLIALLCFLRIKNPLHFGVQGVWGGGGAAVLRLQHFAQALGVVLQRSGARFFAWPA